MISFCVNTVCFMSIVLIFCERGTINTFVLMLWACVKWHRSINTSVSSHLTWIVAFSLSFEKLTMWWTWLYLFLHENFEDCYNILAHLRLLSIWVEHHLAQIQRCINVQIGLVLKTSIYSQWCILWTVLCSQLLKGNWLRWKWRF